jgi:galacturonosyltransferase
LPDNIIALGFTSRVPEILSQSDCLILPSFHEGLSYATLEAMASGCIVIANNIPGIQCLIKSNVNGFLIVNNELVKYGEVLTEIFTNLNAYRFLIQSNAINTSKEYSREIFLKFYLKFLNEIILVNK